MKKLLIFILFATSLTISAEETYTRTEVDLMMQMHEQKIVSQLQQLELKKENVDDKVAYYGDRVEDLHKTLNYFFIIAGMLGTIAIAVVSYFLDKYNKKKAVELKEEVAAQKMVMLESIDKIKLEANKELQLLRDEAKEYLSRIKEEAKEVSDAQRELQETSKQIAASKAIPPVV